MVGGRRGWKMGWWACGVAGKRHYGVVQVGRDRRLENDLHPFLFISTWPHALASLIQGSSPLISWFLCDAVPFRIAQWYICSLQVEKYLNDWRHGMDWSCIGSSATAIDKSKFEWQLGVRKLEQRTSLLPIAQKCSPTLGPFHVHSDSVTFYPTPRG